MSMSAEWGHFVQKQRTEKKLTRRTLAERAAIDPSYVTLIERDGYVPKREKVIAIAAAMELNSDEALLQAGYAPVSMNARGVLNAMAAYKMAKALPKT